MLNADTEHSLCGMRKALTAQFHTVPSPCSFLCILGCTGRGGTFNMSAYAVREPNDSIAVSPDGTDAMQCAVQPSAILVVEGAAGLLLTSAPLTYAS